MDATESARWLRIRRRVAAPRLRLICFPYAGAGATVYHGWPDELPAHVEVAAVQLPARQDRVADPPVTRVEDIVDRVAAAMAALPPAPRTAFFGHSFGAVLAFELARRQQRAGAAPAALVVAGRRAPHLPSPSAPAWNLPDDEFFAVLNSRYGTSMAMLRDRDLMELALPSLRADFEALDHYRYAAGDPLRVPITVLRGTRDPRQSASDADAWTEVAAPTHRPVTIHELDAEHFFVDTHRLWVIDRVAEALARAAAPGAPGSR